MKKFLILAVMFLIFSASVFAWQTPKTFNPKKGNDIAWTPAVNESGGYLYNGDVVCWSNVSCSTRTAVTTTTTVGAGNVAGVWIVQLGARTANGDVGLVQIYGYNSAIRVKSTSIAVYDLLIATSTARYGSDIDPTNVTTQQGIFGIAFQPETGGTATTIKGFIKATGN